MEIAIPLSVTVFVVAGLVKRVGVFDAFLSGAKEGFSTAFTIVPSMVGLITAVTMLRASGVFEWVSQVISPLAEGLGFPSEIVPVALMRPVSGSGSTALILSAFEEFGADSFVGKILSVMAGSTETTVYAIAVYYASVGIKKTRHTLVSGLCADFAAVVFSVLSVRLFME